MKAHSLAAIVALDRNNAIGRGGDLLCHLPADLRHFKQLTLSRSVVMGRRTFESLPRGPLPGRQNIVISRSTDFHPWGAVPVHSLEQAIAVATADVMIIGGGQIYAQAFPLVDTLHLTRIDNVFADADTFFPVINLDEWHVVDREAHSADERNPYPYEFVTLRRITR